MFAVKEWLTLWMNKWIKNESKHWPIYYKIGRAVLSERPKKSKCKLSHFNSFEKVKGQQNHKNEIKIFIFKKNDCIQTCQCLGSFHSGKDIVWGKGGRLQADGDSIKRCRHPWKTEFGTCIIWAYITLILQQYTISCPYFFDNSFTDI